MYDSLEIPMRVGERLLFIKYSMRSISARRINPPDVLSVSNHSYFNSRFNSFCEEKKYLD